ncbi:MAG: peroxiredoxin [Chloroflexi bacterium]|nr:MAG: peroxiredoxin [Chloroflexota bacterium]MBL1195743.1 peroxiredoxin [Chloroflexota bacterium]NOH13032.1 redoxin domain-containing protein [Chloroflexota bacterium]
MSGIPTGILAAGTQAPDFDLPSTQNNSISLDSLKGKASILVFYPGDFTTVCSDQLALYNEVLPMFEEHDAQLIGISVDSLNSHYSFAEERNFSFPLLADDKPLGEMARNFGVFDENSQTCDRALFVIDAQGVIQWSYLSPRGVNPGANGILDALEGMKETSHE